MAILKIARMGHPVLRRVADPVADPRAPEIRRLVADMVDTLEDIGGAGLAAPQVHVPLRVVIFRVRAERVTGDPEDVVLPMQALVNPAIEPLGEEKNLRWEGCLSVPGLRGAVPRWRRLRYRGLDLDGNPVERVVAAYHAGLVQHEFDHLDGILYPARMTDFSLFGFNEEIAKYPPEVEAVR
ncbi:MAG: peptide deformylase [Alphaproteobacteria bacterium]|nr:peptide deformylase [Alphaproteobacteria bacterium]